MSYVINVENNNQKVLMECELQGQISDGYWENARPHYHYKKPSSATVNVVDSTESVGINFYLDRKYDFTSYNLLKYVGERMLNMVRLSILFPNASNEDLRNMGEPEWIVQQWNNTDQYYVNKRNRLSEVFNIHNLEDVTLLVDKMSKVSYTKKDMKKDLTRLKEIFDNRF